MAALTMASQLPGPPTNAKKLHPFFTAPRSSNDENRPPAPTKAVEQIEEKDNPCNTSPKQNRRKKRKTPDLDDQKEKEQQPQEPQEPPQKKRGRPAKKPPVSTHDDKPLLPPEPPSTRASNVTKRDGHVPVVTMDQDEASITVSRSDANRNSVSSNMEINIRDESATTIDKPPVPPQAATRMLKIDPATGTFGLPSSPKSTRAGLKQTGVSSRPKRSVTVRYGLDEDTRLRVGPRIQAILNGQGNSRLMPSKPPTKSKAQNKTGAAVQVPHPFFKVGQKESAAATEATSIPKQSAPRHFTSTPVSPRKQRALAPALNFPQFGIKSTGLRIPGAQHPAWPWKGATHVRGEAAYTPLPADKPTPPDSPRRKSKGRATFITKDESVLDVQARQLNIPAIVGELETVDFDRFEPPPREVRLPQKYFESGRKLQARITPQLSSQCPSLKPLFDSIGTNLSAFDRAECESLSWTHKYAPVKATEVLQSGWEPLILKDWLTALKVESVDKGPGDKVTSAKSKGSGDAPRKKRKKTKLDGFIVSSDDDADESFADFEDERDWSPSGRHGVSKPTVVKAKGSSDGRLANVIILSGPLGCGKTAAVYAAATELDFEVFEINPSVRRNAKDVTEKIGDMTRNHLIQHHQAAEQASGPMSLVDDDEISSGKQSTMASFFQKKPTLQTKGKKGSKQSQKPPAQPLQGLKSAKSQKQSLLLLEEVDLLYEEDKTLWSAVVTLMAQSKRPFIMTCNDETLVPLHMLDLHAILRFTTPPVDTAVDRLILIAANEGHALEQQAVQSLFEARGYDFRATLMDLQYWCQIGIGDRRGGVDWFYMRYPKGVDIDEEGWVVRVVSGGTYQTGMGWLGRDSLVDDVDNGQFEEKAMLQTWDGWGHDLGDWQNSPALHAWSDDVCKGTPDAASRLKTLAAYEDFVDSMSAADIASSMAFGSGNKKSIDATLPELPSKARDDYIIGLQLLEAPILEHYESKSIEISSAIKSVAKKELQNKSDRLTTGHQRASLAPLTEASAVKLIRKLNSEQTQQARQVGRIDFAFAFDPIASADPLMASGSLEASVFDRNFEPIVVDVAPYVRTIVAYDAQLQQQRLKLSNLVSEGGRGPKRIRTTRAALSALEGGQRSTTRKEKWFKADLNTVFVKQTAGEGWEEAAAEEMDKLKEESETRVAKVESKAGDEDDDADELA